MRRWWNARVGVLVLVVGSVAAPMLPGCDNSPAVEPPKEIPPPPKEASKASFEALKGQPKTPTKPAPAK